MKKAYTGINRRGQERRQLRDRRQTIRFEPAKEPRRLTSDRRGGAVWELTFSDR